ncbi:MAG: extracellular solute-binding protein [Leucobacter sp.]
MKLKKVLLGSVAAFGVVALAACSGSAEPEAGQGSGEYAGQTLPVTTFGGDWEAAFVEAVVDPFEAETGAKVELVTLYSADALAQLTAQAASPQVDVVHFSGGQEFVAAQEGLIDPIAADEIESYDDLAAVAVQGLEEGEGPAIQLAPIGLVFNTESGATKPTSWLDLFDAEYAGHLALTDFSNSYGVISMLRVADAQGNGIDDADSAIKELGSLVNDDSAIVVSTSPDLQTAFAQRNVWLAPYSMDYASTLKDAGLPVEFITPEEGAGASLVTANIVSGRDNIELSKLFVNFELRPEAQQVFAEKMRYSPVNSQTELSEDISGDVLMGSELDGISIYAPGDIAEKRTGWVDAWNSLITQ